MYKASNQKYEFSSPTMKNSRLLLPAFMYILLYCSLGCVQLSPGESSSFENDSSSEIVSTPDALYIDEREVDDQDASLASEYLEEVELNLDDLKYSPAVGILTAKSPDARINLRSEPLAYSSLRGYGLVGDTVQLLDAKWCAYALWNEHQIESDRQLYNPIPAWYYVRFPLSRAEGWIRSDYIKIQKAIPSVKDLEIKSSLAKLTQDQIKSLLLLDQSNIHNLDVKIIIPGYLPTDYELVEFDVKDGVLGPSYLIRYESLAGHDITLHAYSSRNGKGAGIAKVEFIPIQSKALGKVTAVHILYDGVTDDSFIDVEQEKGIIASPQMYDVYSSNPNVEDFVKVVENLIYLNP